MQLMQRTMCCRNSMSALDLSTYILASFTTVQEVKEALDPAHFTVVNFQLFQAAMDVLLASGLLAPGAYPTIHLGIHDAMHNSLVIEFTGMPEHLQPVWHIDTTASANFQPDLAHVLDLSVYWQCDHLCALACRRRPCPAR